jgi:hypothetical protein
MKGVKNVKTGGIPLVIIFHPSMISMPSMVNSVVSAGMRVAF